MRTTKVSFAAVCLLAALILFSVVTALAREVEVTRSLEGTTVSQAREDALKAGFIQAVQAEALEVLPTPLPEARQKVFLEQLAAKAQGLVLGYSETKRDATDKSITMTLDVTVNRPALKKVMQDLGVYGTPTGQSGSGGMSVVRISVEGWKSPDGVAEVDRLLNSMDRVVDGARLQGVHMLPARVKAVWEVRLFDREALEKRLKEALSGKGLTFAIS